VSVRWNPFRRSAIHPADDRSPAAQLLAQGEAAQAHDAAGRHELAREGFAEVVAAYRQELATRPDDPEITALLADRLNGLGQCLGALRRFDDATAVLDEGLEISRRAVELRRATVDGAADLDLARALRTFALVRANAGVELNEAVRAVDEAAAVHMAALAAAPDQEQLAETYATELAQARVLARQGRHVEAARVADLARSGHLDEMADMLRAQRPPR
jgi:tetratricopeptide (TPR) repeat protein